MISCILKYDFMYIFWMSVFPCFHFEIAGDIHLYPYRYRYAFFPKIYIRFLLLTSKQFQFAVQKCILIANVPIFAQIFNIFKNFRSIFRPIQTDMCDVLWTLDYMLMNANKKIKIYQHVFENSLNWFCFAKSLIAIYTEYSYTLTYRNIFLKKKKKIRTIEWNKIQFYYCFQ